jgi:hypothetical protein
MLQAAYGLLEGKPLTLLKRLQASIPEKVTALLCVWVDVVSRFHKLI